ncbi:epoxide hydrolase family protein [Microbacterium trichothecenolyticum]|uniref:Pimeloyl-ACP methyl ester carboxylesterase n=1 Tax=Microbacterium trichothecenolyticum TaxID=69370 RepID=A0ABU0TW25_MICTR|nr:epoxide hydrolase [Microbacterium trichothecenolyticum]MDQ1123867.1 pimeloyl-ACP methyl ester carboxylesterase [Microbacterium trichothecenolyticum]
MITRLHPRTAPDEVDDLRRRIAMTRWPDDVGDDWSRGTRPSALRRLLDAWAVFDWGAVEERLRAEEHVLVGEPGERLHLWRSGTVGAPAVVLVHGWPDSFVRFRQVAARLDDFDVIVPSIPGFGFSDAAPRDAGGPRWNAERIVAAVDEVGVERFVVHGGDLGTAIADQVAQLARDRVAGLHLSDVPLWRAAADDQLSNEEREWVDAAAAWERHEGAYAAEQRTKPQTLAAGLTDSPAGLASWYLEKFQAWGEGDVFERIPLDLLLENLSVHWFTRTAGSAARVYFDRRRFPPTGGRVTVPTAFGLFPHDIDHGVESFARRWYPTVRFTRFPAGGHFGAMEHPDMLAADLRALLNATA